MKIGPFESNSEAIQGQPFRYALVSTEMSYLIQLSGSFLQSVLHLNRSHDNQPMGGVKARPLSNPCTLRHKEANNVNS